MVKVERSFPPPPSLTEEAKKKSGSYEKEDVVAQLKHDFNNKCYICELKDLQDPQVEHLLPHKNGRYWDRKFDWENLFWVCGHCNGVKNQSKYDKGILDCCKKDPEDFIDFQLKANDIELINKSSLPDREINRTIELIEEVFNIQNTGMRVYKSQERLRLLLKEMNLLYDNLEKIRLTPDSKDVLRKLRVLLRRESAFAAFKRSYVRRHLSDYPQLEEYIR